MELRKLNCCSVAETDVAILLKDEGLRARVQEVRCKFPKAFFCWKSGKMSSWEALTSEPPPPVEENVGSLAMTGRYAKKYQEISMI